MWIIPATLVHESSELATECHIVFYRSLIVYACYEAFVCDVEECHSRSFIDTTTFCLYDTVLYLVTHPESMSSTDAVCFEHHLYFARIGFSIDLGWYSFFEFDCYNLVLYDNIFVPVFYSHDGIHDIHRCREFFEILGLMCGSEDIGIGTIGFFG